MVPAAAVIPSLIAFSYVVAVKKFVATISSACHFEKIGVFITGKPLHSTAKNDMPAARAAGRSIWQRGVDTIGGGQVK